MKITFLIRGALSANQETVIKKASAGKNKVSVVSSPAEVLDSDLLVYGAGFGDTLKAIEGMEMISFADYKPKKEKTTKAE